MGFPSGMPKVSTEPIALRERARQRGSGSNVTLQPVRNPPKNNPNKTPRRDLVGSRGNLPGSARVSETAVRPTAHPGEMLRVPRGTS